MKLSKSGSLLLTALALASSSTFCMSLAAQAVPTLTYSSVERVTPLIKHRFVSSVFEQPDPSFSGVTLSGFEAGHVLLPNIASWTNQVNPGIAPGGVTGMNIPALHTGLLPNVGNFFSIEGWYSTPTNVSADPGLFFVVQTADGLYHTASFTTVPSNNVGTNNGRTNWFNFISSINSFSPALAASGTGSQINKIAIVFDGTVHGVNSINQILSPGEPPPGSGSGFFVLNGSNGFLINNPGTGLANFTVLAHPADGHFNFELNGPNN